NCMVHCGYEASAVNDTVRHPIRALKVALKGVRTEGPMAPEIPLGKQRPAEFVFDRMVAGAVEELHGAKASADGTEDADSIAAE
ncbi:MAG: hopanoid biosynthesis associated radical SAM protein HpnH, partial [Kiloniellales bacterium]